MTSALDEVWTEERVSRLAPDPASAKAGRGLSDKAKWASIARDERALWGECKGSAAEPYRTEIELSEPAFKCTCPSRKFPCKHALGLLFLFAANSAAFAASSAPAWVSEWLAKREQQEKKKTEKQAKKQPEEIGPEDQAKREAGKVRRAQDRAAKVSAGVAELELWLQDLIRNGLAAAKSQPLKIWTDVAARMIDAQAPGIARRLNLLGEMIAGGGNWAEQVTAEMGRLYLLIQAYKRINSLPEALAADVRSAVGWSLREEEIIRQGGIRDDWQVTGQRSYEEDRLQVRRTWLTGSSSGKPALILDFAYGGQSMDAPLVPGTRIDADLVYYPASYPLRAAVKERFGPPGALDSIAGAQRNTAVAERYCDALCANPWLEVLPATLGEVIPVIKNQKWYLMDALDKTLIAIARDFHSRWQLMGVAGGNPISVFGEWNGLTFLPLGAFAEGRFIDFAISV